MELNASNVLDTASEPVLARAADTVPLAVSLKDVNLAQWVLTLRDSEYQQCAPGEHKSCGASTADDGRAMSICVEEVGGHSHRLRALYATGAD